MKTLENKKIFIGSEPKRPMAAFVDHKEGQTLFGYRILKDADYHKNLTTAKQYGRGQVVATVYGLAVLGGIAWGLWSAFADKQAFQARFDQGQDQEAQAQ